MCSQWTLMWCPPGSSEPVSFNTKTSFPAILLTTAALRNSPISCRCLKSKEEWLFRGASPPFWRPGQDVTSGRSSGHSVSLDVNGPQTTSVGWRCRNPRSCKPPTSSATNLATNRSTSQRGPLCRFLTNASNSSEPIDLVR